MLISIVEVHVKPNFIEAFIEVTKKNVEGSLGEPGVARFDFLQDDEEPTKFVLYEVYRSAEDPAKHRETHHYKEWKDAVSTMMMTPRTKVIYNNILPLDRAW